MKKYGASAGNVGDEGGIAPDIQTAEEALELIAEAIEAAGYTGKVKTPWTWPRVSSTRWRREKYDLDFKNPDSDPTKWITYEELAALYSDLSKKYPLSALRIPSPRTTGRRGATSTRRRTSRL